MDRGEPRTPKLTGNMSPRKEKVMAKPDKEPDGLMESSANSNGDQGKIVKNMHMLSKGSDMGRGGCTKNFPAGSTLGGHMLCHRHAGMQPKSTPRPAPTVVDSPVLLLGPSDEKPSLLSAKGQFLDCSKEFSACQSLRGNMRMCSAKKVMAKPDKEPYALIEASANLKGDHGHHVMLFSPVKFVVPEGSGIQNSTANPLSICPDLSVEKYSLPSLEIQCLDSSNEISACQSLRGNMSVHSEKVMAKPGKELDALMESSANSNGDQGKNVKKGPKMYSCPSCGKEFQSHGALRGHRSRGHCHPNVAGQKSNKREVSKIVQGVVLNATNCGADFHTFQLHGSHRSQCNKVVRNGPEKYYCKYCGQDFPKSRSASSHMGRCKYKNAPHTSSRHVLASDDDDDAEILDAEDPNPQG